MVYPSEHAFRPQEPLDLTSFAGDAHLVQAPRELAYEQRMETQ